MQTQINKILCKTSKTMNKMSQLFLFSDIEIAKEK